MKILQVHNFYRTRGGECSVVNAERELLESHGHEVIPYYRDSRDIDNWRLSKKALMLANLSYSHRVGKDLTDFVRREIPDVAHVHNVFPLLTPAVYRVLKACGVPVVQTVHNFRFLCPNGQFYVHDQICERCQECGFYSAVLHRCMQDNVLISCAYAVAIARAWQQGILPSDIDTFIVMNGFFSERLIRAGIARECIRRLGNFVPNVLDNVPPKQNYVLYLGRLSREKGIRTLLTAWERIEDVNLRIAGSGPLNQEIRGQAQQLGSGRVELLGHVEGDSKRELVKGAVCVVVPSEWYENFPISVVEAMANGTPVVASRIGGLPEMVVDGVTGLLCEPGDAVSLAAAVRRLVSDRVLATQLAQGALTAARQLYGPELHYEGLVEIYKNVIHRKSN